MPECGQEKQMRMQSEIETRKFIFQCPVCRHQELREASYQYLREHIILCGQCNVPIRVYEQDGTFVCGGFFLTPEPPRGLMGY